MHNYNQALEYADFVLLCYFGHTEILHFLITFTYNLSIPSHHSKFCNFYIGQFSVPDFHNLLHFVAVISKCPVHCVQEYMLHYATCTTIFSRKAVHLTM